MAGTAPQSAVNAAIFLRSTASSRKLSPSQEKSLVASTSQTAPTKVRKNTSLALARTSAAPHRCSATATIIRLAATQKPDAQRTLLFILTCATSPRVHSAIKRCSDQGTIRFCENKNRVFLDGKTRAEAFASVRVVASWRP